MKREVVCSQCEEEVAPTLKKTAGAHGEFFKTVKGQAKRDFKCDQCAKQIRVGTDCYAWSIAAQAAQYHAWESLYLDLSS